jgi:predicted transcriptional regulator
MFNKSRIFKNNLTNYLSKFNFNLGLEVEALTNLEINNLIKLIKENKLETTEISLDLNFSKSRILENSVDILKPLEN